MNFTKQTNYLTIIRKYFFNLSRNSFNFSFKGLVEDYNDSSLSELIPIIYKFTLGENYFQKIFDRYKKNLKSSAMDPQIIIRTQELEYTNCYEKEKTIKNLMIAIHNIKIMSTCLNFTSKKVKSKDNILFGGRGRKVSQFSNNFLRNTTLKKNERKKSNVKLNMKNSIEKEQSLISEDNSEFESASLSPHKSKKISIYIKKKISEQDNFK